MFYSTVRPIIIICKILGTFTIKNAFTKDARFLQYKLLSFDALWSPVLHFSCFYTFWKYGTFPWWITTIPIFACRSSAVGFLSIYYDRRVLDFILHLEEFDHLLMLTNGKGHNLAWFSRGITWMIPTLAIFSASIPGAYFMVSSNPERTILRSLVECAMTLTSGLAIKSFIILYFLFCVNLRSRFDDISSHLREVISRISSQKSGRPWVLPEEKIQFGNSLEEIRVLFEHLAEGVRKLNRCFGARLAFHMVLCFLQLVVDFYQFNYAYDSGLVSAAVFFLYHVLNIIVMGAVTECMTSSASILYYVRSWYFLNL